VRPTGRFGAAEYPFTERLDAPSGFLQGRTLLLEDDPSVPYEQVVTDFARQSISNNQTVYVFTAKGSPIYTALHKMNGVRFYILSSKVAYPKPEENEPSQILVPANDQAVILDLLDKTINTAESPSQVAIVFDSISDMILSASFESTYKFVKQVNEVTGNGKTTALFLMTLGAHEEKVVSFIRSLFPTQLVDDNAGLKMTRSQ
jgi:archaellum biogenesis ATPase FlaH